MFTATYFGRKGGPVRKQYKVITILGEQNLNNNLFDRATHQERRSYLIKLDSYRDENILSSCSGKCEKCNNPINVISDTKHAGMSSTE